MTVVADKVEADQPEPDPTPTRRDRLREINLGLTLAFAIYSFWLTSNRTWNPDGRSPLSLGGDFFYWSQADSIIHGQVHVVTPRSWWLECFTIDGMCRGYFGITPSILRVPVYTFFGGTQLVGLNPLFAALALALAFWAALDLLRQLIDRFLVSRPDLSATVARKWFVLAAVLLGPGSVLVFLARGRVYEEAITWCAAFLLVTLNLIYRWSLTKRTGMLVGAIATASLATLSRPSAIPAVVVLGIAVILLGWRWGGWLVRGLGAALAVVPSFLFAFIFWRKFGSLSFPWPDYSPYIVRPDFKRTIDANDKSTVGFRFILTTLANYLRPDSIHFSSSAPFIRLSSVTPQDLLVLPTASRVQLWGDHIPSLTNVMPVPLVLTFIAIAQQVRLVFRRALHGMATMPGVLLLAALAACAPAVMYYAMAGRYLGDTYPLLVVGTALALPFVIRQSLKPAWWAKAIFPTLCVLAVFASVVAYELHDGVF